MLGCIISFFAEPTVEVRLIEVWCGWDYF